MILYLKFEWMTGRESLRRATKAQTFDKIERFGREKESERNDGGKGTFYDKKITFPKNTDNTRPRFLHFPWNKKFLFKSVRWRKRKAVAPRFLFWFHPEMSHHEVEIQKFQILVPAHKYDIVIVTI